MAGWLKGLIKEVVSGDTVVVVAATQGPAVPPEKRLTLSSLVAPRLVRFVAAPCYVLLICRLAIKPSFRLTCCAQGKRDGSTRDEAFAWESREFLRKKLIGQVMG